MNATKDTNERLLDSSVLGVFLAVFGLTAAIGLTACGEDFFSENTIVDIEVEPSSIPKENTGMTDQYFTIEVIYRGFEGGVSDVEVFIQDPTPGEAERVATVRDGSMEMFPDESRIVFETAQSWFSGLETGTYDIGAHISGTTDDGLEAEPTVRNLATITVTE